MPADQGDSQSSKAPDRRDLAEWMVDPRHPLTARVAANRVWYWLMGEGLVDTVDNFGTTGNAPSHPELLDYLAVRLIEKDWSMKELTKEILMSDTYMRSSQGRSDEARQKDPDNRLYAWGNRKRLDAECLRDAMLQISGQLDLTMGDVGFRSRSITTMAIVTPNLAEASTFLRSEMRLPIFLPPLIWQTPV